MPGLRESAFCKTNQRSTGNRLPACQYQAARIRHSQKIKNKKFGANARGLLNANPFPD
jgi:hypothetical protein